MALPAGEPKPLGIVKGIQIAKGKEATFTTLEKMPFVAIKQWYQKQSLFNYTSSVWSIPEQAGVRNFKGLDGQLK